MISGRVCWGCSSSREHETLERKQRRDDTDASGYDEKDELRRIKRQDKARQGQAGHDEAKAITGFDTV